MKDPWLARNRALRVAIRLALGAGELPAQDGGELPPGPNPVQARQLLAMAGYPGGMELPTLDLGFDGASASDQGAAAFIRGRLEAVGIRIHLRGLKAGGDLETEMKLSKIPLWAGSWEGNPALVDFALALPGVPEPSASPSAPPSPSSGDAEPLEGREIDRLLGALGSDTVSLSDRGRLGKFLADDSTAIFGFRRMARFGIRTRLKNFKFHELGSGMARYYRADPTSR